MKGISMMSDKLIWFMIGVGGTLVIFMVLYLITQKGSLFARNEIDIIISSSLIGIRPRKKGAAWLLYVVVIAIIVVAAVWALWNQFSPQAAKFLSDWLIQLG